MADGRVKALWVIGTNPAVSLPDADRVRAALAACPFLVVSDCVRRTDTTEAARILLAAAAWGEKDGTVTNSERRVSRQRAFLPPPGEARADWWILAQVARRLGHGDAFPYLGPAEIFAEHATLSGRVAQDLDLSGAAGLDYASLTPFQWGGDRPFADGRFFTADCRARFVPVHPRGPAATVGPEFPLLLATGRYRDQWHTMTRTGLSPFLARHRPEPLLELGPADAQAHGLADGALAQVTSPHGTAVLRIRVTDDQPPGRAFAPLHWNGQTASLARIDALVAPVTDPFSGQPEFKATPVAVRPFRSVWRALLLGTRQPALDSVPYWVRARVPGG